MYQAKTNNKNAIYVAELDSKLMYAWSWILKAFKNWFDNSSLCALFVKDMHFSNAHMYEMSKWLFTKNSCMHVLKDARNLERSSQVFSSLFRANLRELTLVYQRIQIQKLSPIYPKETESKTLLLKLGWWQQMPPT